MLVPIFVMNVRISPLDPILGPSVGADSARGTHVAGWSVCQRAARIVGARLRRENPAPIAVVEFEAASTAASFEFVW